MAGASQFANGGGSSYGGDSGPATSGGGSNNFNIQSGGGNGGFNPFASSQASSLSPGMLMLAGSVLVLGAIAFKMKK